MVTKYVIFITGFVYGLQSPNNATYTCFVTEWLWWTYPIVMLIQCITFNMTLCLLNNVLHFYIIQATYLSVIPTIFYISPCQWNCTDIPYLCLKMKGAYLIPVCKLETSRLTLTLCVFHACYIITTNIPYHQYICKKQVWQNEPMSPSC